MLVAVWLGMGLAVGLAGGQQGAKRPMTFADLMAMKRVSDPQISVSGKWVMFSVTDVSLAANTKTNHLWTVPIGGSTAATPEKQVTFGDGEENGRFSPDAKYVSYEMKGQVYLAGWDDALGKPGPARQLTDVSTGAGGAVWSPDAGRLLFVSQVYPECSAGGPKNVAGGWAEEEACDKAQDAEAAGSKVKAMLFTSLLYRHWNAFTGEKRSHVLAVSVGNGRGSGGTDVRDLTPFSAVGYAETPTFSLGGPLGYTWAPDSHEIAYVTNLDKVPAASTNNDVFTLRLDESGAKAVKVSTSPGSDDGPQYSPDGKWLAFRSQARAGYESDRFRLMVMDRTAKTLVDLMPDYDGWVDEFSWTSNSQDLLFVTAKNGEAPYGIAPIVDHSPRQHEYRVNTSELGEFSDVHALPDLTIIATRMKIDAPSEIVRIAPQKYDDKGNFIGTQRPLVLTHLNDKTLSQLAFSPMQSYAIVGAEDAKVQGFVVKPPDFDAGKKYPVKFLIHGGPQGAWGDGWSYRWNPELMAASGYVVVMVNPRGSTGYGQAFIDGVNGDWGGKAYVDLMKGMDAAEQQFPFIDKDRECALGASYGGFMANWVLTHTNRFKCIVSHDGMYNPVSAYGTTEELWFNEWEFRRPGDSQPGQPWRYASLPADQDPFRKWSPELFIQNAKTPTLVIHSQKDYRLDVSEGFQLFTALQRLGVPSEMLYFPDEGHWVQKPQNSELWNKTVSDWCDKWTHMNAYAGK